MGFVLSESYSPVLDFKSTESAIKYIKDTFESELAAALNLQRISAPLFVRPETGLNDNLNGVERPVSFDCPAVRGNLEIVHSLAKWKRMALGKYGYAPGEGIYTDMNAIRRDEETDNLHSIYVDQWDWEMVIEKKNRTEDTLKSVVRKIYGCVKSTQNKLYGKYPELAGEALPEDIFFITTQQLEDMYPDATIKERERLIAKDKGAVFLMQIGGMLKSGIKHDGRAPDYDDWKLNGDIILYYPMLGIPFEISSMGIRVDEASLAIQLKEAGCEDRLEMDFHKKLASGELPYTIGGGIGQSRLCMFMLKKAHIGEAQVSVWDDETCAVCRENNIHLL